MEKTIASWDEGGGRREEEGGGGGGKVMVCVWGEGSG